jgi:hypothetical protein
MGCGFLHVAQRDAGIEGCGDERVPQRVRADVLGDLGAAGDPADHAGGAVPVQPPPVRSGEQRPGGPLADRQVDRPGSPGCERDGDDLAALMGTSGSPVLCGMCGAGGLLRQQPAGEHLFRPGREVLTQDRAPAGSPGGWTADGVACPAPAVSTDPLGRWRFSLMLPDATERVRKGRELLYIGDDWAEGVRHEVAWCE